MPKKITDEVFINLYIGVDYADVTGLRGGKLLISVPGEYLDDIDEIRRECSTILHEYKKEEFSIVRRLPSDEKMLFRVTAFENTSGGLVFTIRRPPARVLEFDELGFGSELVGFLTKRELRGVVGFVGEMSSGKTTAAASTVHGRLKALGGLAMAIEDPPETNLDGVHGDGRCIGVEVRSSEGGYRAATKKAMRTGADIIYLGEVRDEDAAVEVVMGGNNGHLIISTWHAASHEDAVKRLNALCGSAVKDAQSMLATGLAAIVHLRMEERMVSTLRGKKPVKHLAYELLEVRGHQEVENIIRNGSFHMLKSAMETQKSARRTSF
ncbi:ATPase, T2SS/T4P/T4SS family [Burkholderia pseudomallei]|uniref:ATPase, T2SS/T4P/T4SS family n=1 Tax=Burkholderia pseudomallei TaxID=28450 RepID=UPI000A1A1120|nr:ATPase, T2SS/T4P/T4SS family [Burkholderia pseudomallei]ARL04299.1 hypothetical protein BOC44_21255 [Burkholderia pseudomallei]